MIELCLTHLFLTFTGHQRKAVVMRNAVLSAQITIYAVLQTGITGGLQARTETLKVKVSVIVHHALEFAQL